MNRTTHEVLLLAETPGAWLKAAGRGGWDTGRLAKIYEDATLYDEHTWGAFASIDAPTSLFTRAQWNRKAGFAYSAAAESHDVLARAARAFAETRGQHGGEG